MEIWTVANLKGGVGKTTTAVALGGLLAAWGFRTLMVDIDAHASLSAYFGYDPDELEFSTYDMFLATAERRNIDISRLIYSTDHPRLDLVPATTALAGLDRQSGRLDGLGLVLKRFLPPLEHKYDYVLIDCPPVLGILLINALAVCDRLVIPVQTEFLAMKGLERMLRTINMVLRVRQRSLSYTIVPTYFDPRTRSSIESLAQLRRDYTEHLWHGYIPVDTRLRDASRAGVPPAFFDPRSRAVAAYTDLLETLRRDSASTPATAVQPPAVADVATGS
ncbi:MULTISPECIES: ParA family protein [Thiorhodovibrio]|uniref:ParA family protein n=1 Tax=Thiorhodovibrio TaxID=61593 RepID=UPI0019113EDC|nr:MULTISPECIES: ParA family protein [Thiorhodovibrio]MBK5971205.1 cobalamin biosynthesis protein CobQ [Thiorhodovibrio winogradskyi]WPL14646.1 Sporulation initiation inhibitor protein soj [Thiorhodovibrio litoralis]